MGNGTSQVVQRYLEGGGLRRWSPNSTRIDGMLTTIGGVECDLTNPVFLGEATE